MTDHWDEKAYPWDKKTPRFYPPGQHPALFQLRAQLTKAEEFLRGWPEGTGSASSRRGLERYIRSMQDEVAAYEERESEEKARAFYKREGKDG